MSRQEVLPGLTAARYQRHPLHGENAVWAEKNCYGDMWIELLHALKLEPLASLAYTLAVDFEGDQWTFFKPPLDELRELSAGYRGTDPEGADRWVEIARVAWPEGATASRQTPRNASWNRPPTRSMSSATHCRPKS